MELKGLLMQFINLNFKERKNNRKGKTRDIQLHQMQHAPHARNSCPAKDAVCRKCTKKGHFAKVVAAVEQQGEDSDSSEVFLGAISVCRNFCMDCFSKREVCENHKDLFSCEYCMKLIRNASNITCTRSRTMLSISEQDPAYERSGHLIPFYHIDDIGHNIKNSQASLDRGTHFDRKSCHDSTDLAILMRTAPDDIVQLISRGLSHKAISQLDKHSDEQSLQRVLGEVIEAGSQISMITKTDVLKLRRSWFVDLHDKIISILFFI